MAIEVETGAAGMSASPRSSRGAALGFWLAVAASVAIYAPILWYMGIHWYNDDNYSHGFLVVPLAAYFAWERRGAIRKATLASSWWGLAFLVAGAVALAVGRLGVEQMSMRVSFVLTLHGLVLLLLGRHIYRVLFFPLAFLFLMVPLPQSLVNVVAFPLQLVAADIAVNALYHLQVPALREGNIIHLANTTLFVAEACSGLRSLMALFTLGVVFAYFFRRNLVERAIIVVSAIPIAILVNTVRVTITGILAHRFGNEAATGAIHEFQGLITFGLAFVLLLAEARLIEVLRSETVESRPSEGAA